MPVRCIGVSQETKTSKESMCCCLCCVLNTMCICGLQTEPGLFVLHLSSQEWATSSHQPSSCALRSVLLKSCSSWTTQMVKVEGLDKTMPNTVLTFYQYRPISCAQEHAVAWLNMLSLCICCRCAFSWTLAWRIYMKYNCCLWCKAIDRVSICLRMKQEQYIRFKVY